MGTLYIHFTGVCVYVPKSDKKSLQVILSNGAGRLHRDGTSAKRHLPVFFEFTDRIIKEKVDSSSLLHSRLTFSIESAGDTDFSKVYAGSEDWLEVDTDQWRRPHVGKVSALAFLDKGVASIRPSTCSTSWSPSSDWKLDRVVTGVDVKIEQVSKVSLMGTPFGSMVAKELFTRSLRGETLRLALGNLCDDMIQHWNAPPRRGQFYDDDFKSIYWLSKNSRVIVLAGSSRNLPRPVGDVRTVQPSGDGFLKILGLSGCECHGYVSSRADL